MTVEAVDATFGVVGRTFFSVVITAANCTVVCPVGTTITATSISSPVMYLV